MLECLAQESIQSLPGKIAHSITKRVKTNKLSYSRGLFDTLLYFSEDTDKNLSLRVKATLIMYALYRKGDDGLGMGEIESYAASLKDTPEVQEMRRQMKAIRFGEAARPKAAE